MSRDEAQLLDMLQAARDAVTSARYSTFSIASRAANPDGGPAYPVA